MLGAGAPGLPSLAAANDRPGAQTAAYDALGGRFAINGGALGGESGEVCYFGPDTVAWTPIGGGHTAFVQWALEGGLAEFYADLRWPGWEQESAALALDQGIAIYPPPFTRKPAT